MDVLIALLFLAAIIFLGVFGEFIFSRTKVPDVLWLVLFGIIVGPVLGFVSADSLWAIVPVFSAIALMVVMFEGGLHLNIYTVIKNTPSSISLALVSFVLSALAIMIVSEILAFIGVLPNWNIMNGLLLGTILGGASSLIVLPLVNSLDIGKKTRSVLSIESSVTDVLSVIITIAIINFIVASGSVQSILHDISASFAIAVVLGIVAGLVWLYALRYFSRRSPINKHNYMITFAYLLLLYAVVEFVGGSGAISALMFGLMLGNSVEITNMLKLRKTVLDRKVKEFNSQVSFFVKTFFFALIGFLIVFEPIAMVVGTALAIIVLCVRPFAVKIATNGQRIPENEKELMNFMIPRGLAAAVLAVLPSSMGVPGTELFSKIVFMTIIMTIGITTVMFYRQLRKK